MAYAGYQPKLTERCVAEGLGAFLLTLIGGGTAALAALKFSLGQGTNMANLLLVALAHGLVLFVIVLIFGKISGAHVNPAITISLAAIGRFPWAEVLPYIVSQFVGAIVAGAGVLVVYGKEAATIGHLGAPALAGDISPLRGLLIEAVGAGILVMAVVATAVDTRAPAGWAGLAIGMALTVAIMVFGPATGAAINPARAFGPTFVSALAGGVEQWGTYVVAYLIGPIVGGVIAAFIYAYVANLRVTSPPPARPAAPPREAPQRPLRQPSDS